MTTETDYTPSGEAGGNWSGDEEPARDTPLDPQAATEELAGPEPAQLEPSAVSADHEDSLALSDSAQEPVATPTGTPAGEDRLLAAEVESNLLNRWTAIQVSFVENPRASVQDADALVQQIATTFLATFQERRNQLTAAWQHGQPDTEQLRLALQQYRAFIGAILPR